MTAFFGVEPAAVGLSSVTDLAISGEMAASTAAGSTALTATVPMVPTSDDAAFTAAMNSAGAGYLGLAQEHVAQRTAYAGAQTLSSIQYILNELLNAANMSAIV